MLGLVKEIAGQKTIVPLTTDTGTGASVGSLISQYKKVPMSGYLYCDGSTFDETAYPALYLYLGSNVLPDYSNSSENGYVYIKATSGLAENQQENVLNATKDYVDNSNSYSTDETLTGGKWIDGKPIYRKVVDCGAMPNNTVKLVAHNISNLDNTISISGYAKSTIETLPLPFSGILGVIEAYTNSTDIKIGSSYDFSSYSGYVIVEYTKTTD